MGSIAVAGGGGQVGRSIVDGLVAHGGRKIYVLSRSSSNQTPIDGTETLKVDYSDVEGTSKVLQQAHIHTVISAVGIIAPGASEAQIHLIRAADIATSTKRFIISSFESLHRREHIETNPIAKYTFEAIDELEKSSLEYTRVVNGWFLDYYGMPHWKTHLHPWINIVNVQEKWAVIPGDGSAEAHFITTQDLAKFVARLQDLGSWSKVTSVVGDRLSLNGLLEIAERTRNCKFDVAYDSLEKLKEGNISFSHRFPVIGLGAAEDEAFYALLHYQAGSGDFIVPTENSLNFKITDVPITTAEEVIEASWADK